MDRLERSEVAFSGQSLPGGFAQPANIFEAEAESESFLIGGLKIFDFRLQIACICCSWQHKSRSFASLRMTSFGEMRCLILWLQGGGSEVRSGVGADFVPG